MNHDQYKRIDELLDVVLEIEPDKRTAFLVEACAGDEDLRKQVEILLAADNEEHSLMEAGIVLCKQARENLDIVKQSGISDEKIASMLEEIELIQK